jgi:hypothetical protein
MQARAKEASCKSNCHTVQLAAEDFSVQNDGVYSSDTNGDTTPGGETIVDLLPQASNLTNPFTKVQDQPIDGAAAAAGDTGYLGVDADGDGTMDGYVIDGMGKAGTVIITLTSGQ